ncbi:MAG: hypothetical protein ONB44_14715 [candidate division KSB1 bacterium]|nr:hypothetical protein [candidate division KSB1 bacterium]MDZ7312302.1 hypothetical protein [candidate division KSB1 bacterium]
MARWDFLKENNTRQATVASPNNMQVCSFDAGKDNARLTTSIFWAFTSTAMLWSYRHE